MLNLTIFYVIKLFLFFLYCKECKDFLIRNKEGVDNFSN